MPRIIKRYRNRKLYDTERSSYVTLDEIGDMVKAGEDIQIIDKKSGEDLTNVTLAQIILEDQKRAASGDDADANNVPRSALANIVQSSGQLLTRISSPVAKVGDDLRRRAETFEESRQAILRDIVDTASRRVDEMQRRFDESVKDSVDQMTHIPVLRRDLAEAQRKIHHLESEVAMLRQLVEELSEQAQKSGGPRSLPAQKSNPSLAV